MIKELLYRLILILSVVVFVTLVFFAQKNLERVKHVHSKSAIIDINTNFANSSNCTERFATGCFVVQEFTAELNDDTISFAGKTYEIKGSIESGFMIEELDLKVLAESTAALVYMLDYPEEGPVCLDATYTYSYSAAQSEFGLVNSKSLFLNYCQNE